jgi:predicted transcriptional regulator
MIILGIVIGIMIGIKIGEWLAKQNAPTNEPTTEVVQPTTSNDNKVSEPTILDNNINFTGTLSERSAQVLSYLQSTQKPTTVEEISNVLELVPRYTSACVTSLQKKGLVIRTRYSETEPPQVSLTYNGKMYQTRI